VRISKLAANPGTQSRAWQSKPDDNYWSEGMKKLDLSRATSLALCVAVSLALSFTVADAIAALGMKSIAALGGSQTSAQPILAQSRQAAVFDSARVC
jgi:hypothetical protein